LRKSLTEELKPKALKFLESVDVPACIGDVARHLGVSWSTARHLLLELVLEGKIECMKTSRSRIFKIKDCVQSRGGALVNGSH